MTTQEMDRYEKRAAELEKLQVDRYNSATEEQQQNFLLRKHESEVLTLISMFRRASKTYRKD